MRHITYIILECCRFFKPLWARYCPLSPVTAAQSTVSIPPGIQPLLPLFAALPHQSHGHSLPLPSSFSDSPSQTHHPAYLGLWRRSGGSCRSASPRSDPSSVEVLGNFRRFLPSSFSFISYCLDFSHIYSKFSTPFLGFFY